MAKNKKKRRLSKAQIDGRMASKKQRLKTLARETYNENGKQGTFSVDKNLQLKGFKPKQPKKDASTSSSTEQEDGSHHESDNQTVNENKTDETTD